MKILAFAASNSSNSINKQLVSNVCKYYKGIDDEVVILDLHDFEMPLYSADREIKEGIPEKAYRFREQLDWADLTIISFAEHNGNYSAAYKNVADWSSRIKPGKIYAGKNMFLLSTSNGIRGGAKVMEIAQERMKIEGANVISTFSLPQFSQNFQAGKGITTPLLRSQLESAIRKSKKKMRELNEVLNIK
ncbi:MAG TPA: NAD(P)H-dependent oxidoreductase [Candidatus Sphingobacterium stercoripullorum]|nr:NAD(P)H-dependent oxidoreductase [Candidatus Sphingobacterium stercoripullorum]